MNIKGFTLILVFDIKQKVRALKGIPQKLSPSSVKGNKMEKGDKNFSQLHHNCGTDKSWLKWTCTQKKDENSLSFKLTIPQCCYDEEYETLIAYCPFCGYSPSSVKGIQA